MAEWDVSDRIMWNGTYLIVRRTAICGQLYTFIHGNVPTMPMRTLTVIPNKTNEKYTNLQYSAEELELANQYMISGGSARPDLIEYINECSAEMMDKLDELIASSKLEKVQAIIVSDVSNYNNIKVCMAIRNKMDVDDISIGFTG
jgi:hypothetical protein